MTDNNTPMPGDYVRLKGFRNAYVPPEPCGTLVYRAGDNYPYGIIFDDDVRYKEGEKPESPLYGFLLSGFQLAHREACLADSPWIAKT